MGENKYMSKFFKDTMQGLLEVVEMEGKISPRGELFDDFLRELYTEEEIARMHRRAIKDYKREMRRQRKRRRKLKEIYKRLK